MAIDHQLKPSFSPGRKWSIGFNVFLIIIVVFSVVGMINYLSRDYFYRFQWSSRGKIELSPLTMKFLQSLTNQVKVTLYYDKSESIYTTVSALFDEYKFINPRISVETVDYLRDPAGAQKIKDEYKLAAATDKNLIIFECEGRPNIIPGDALSKYILEQLPSEKEPKFRRKPIAFFGETMFTAALLKVTNPKPLNAYTLQGHGEHLIDSGDGDYGYLKFALLLRSENYIRVEPLSLLGTNGVPADCNLLIIAGPRSALPDTELDKIDQYLAQGGRLFVLFNAFSVRKETGLEKILAKWGVEVGHNTIKDLQNSSSGTQGVDIIVTDFSTHAIVNPLLGSEIDLIRPRSIGKLNNPTPAVDAPRVDELADTGPNAVALSVDDPNPQPRRFPLMVAVEKSAPKGVITERGSTRIVVVGDSIFLANVPIQSVANRDFAGYAVNWLLERTQLLEALGPRPIIEYKLVMTQKQLQQVEWLLLAALPGSILLLGILVWLRRRR